MKLVTVAIVIAALALGGVGVGLILSGDESAAPASTETTTVVVRAEPKLKAAPPCAAAMPTPLRKNVIAGGLWTSVPGLPICVTPSYFTSR